MRFAALPVVLLFCSWPVIASGALDVDGLIDPNNDDVVVGSSGVLSASVKFEQVGGNLVITLVNTSTDSDTSIDNARLLTGVFFNMSGGASLTPLTVFLTAGSSIVGDTPTTDVGGEFDYATGFNAGSASFGYGVSSAGLGIFGSPPAFLDGDSPNLDNPVEVDGPNYGLAPAAALTINGNAVFIKTGVIATLSGLGAGPYLITSVRFQYGTALDEPSITVGETPGPIPEPTSLAIWALGMVAAGFGARRMRKQK